MSPKFQNKIGDMLCLKHMYYLKIPIRECDLIINITRGCHIEKPKGILRRFKYSHKIHYTFLNPLS